MLLIIAYIFFGAIVKWRPSIKTVNSGCLECSFFVPLKFAGLGK